MTANMELGTNSHVWCSFWALIPYWQSKWTCGVGIATYATASKGRNMYGKAAGFLGLVQRARDV